MAKVSLLSVAGSVSVSLYKLTELKGCGMVRGCELRILHCNLGLVSIKYKNPY